MSKPMSLTRAKLVAKTPEEFSTEDLDAALTTIVESDRLSERQVTNLQAKIDPVLRSRLATHKVDVVQIADNLVRATVHTVNSGIQVFSEYFDNAQTAAKEAADWVAAAVTKDRRTPAERLASYAAEYADAVWPDLPTPAPTADDLERMELRSERYSEAHTSGEHEIWATCSYKSSEECGLRSAAAEYVESN